MNNPFENREISHLAIITVDGVATYNIGNYVDSDKIVKIEDHSLEYNDGLESIYWCLDKDGKILKVIENCPVDITYREKGE